MSAPEQVVDGRTGLVSVVVPPGAVAAVWLGVGTLFEKALEDGRTVTPQLRELLRALWDADQANKAARRSGLVPSACDPAMRVGPPGGRWFSTRDVADRLGVSSARVLQLRDRGRFPEARQSAPGCPWMFPEHEVEEAERGRR